MLAGNLFWCQLDKCGGSLALNCAAALYGAVLLIGADLVHIAVLLHGAVDQGSRDQVHCCLDLWLALRMRGSI
jgi:hypothetical protein